MFVLAAVCSRSACLGTLQGSSHCRKTRVHGDYAYRIPFPVKTTKHRQTIANLRKCCLWISLARIE
jgi:hypothetical protein